MTFPIISLVSPLAAFGIAIASEIIPRSGSAAVQEHPEVALYLMAAFLAVAVWSMKKWAAADRALLVAQLDSMTRSQVKAQNDTVEAQQQILRQFLDQGREIARICNDLNTIKTHQDDCPYCPPNNKKRERWTIGDKE